MSGNGEGEGNRGYWEQVDARMALHERFVPRNRNGNPLPRSQQWGNIMFEEEYPQMRAREAQRMAEEAAAAEAARIAEAEREAARAAAVDALVSSADLSEPIRAQIQELIRLDRAARNAPSNDGNVDLQEGSFKRDPSGKLYRYTTRYWKKIDPSAANFNASAAASAPESVENPSAGDYKKIKGKLFRWTEEPAWLQVDRKTNYNIDLADTFARHNALGKPYLNARDRLWSILYPEEPPIHRPARYRRRNTRRANRRKNNTRKY